MATNSLKQQQADKENPTKSKLLEALPAVLIFVITIVIWQLATVIFEIPQFLLPSPLATIERIQLMWSDLFYHLKWTMIEAVGGFLLGSLLAFIVAVAFVHIPLFEQSLYPWAVVLQTIPIVALSPLFALWMGYEIDHKIAIATVVVFFPVLVNTTRGLRDVSPASLELMKILSASKLDIFLRLRLPSSLPYLFAGLRISSTLAVIGAIVAEFNGAARGIGWLVYAAGIRLDTRTIFAGIVFSSAAGIIFFQIISGLEKLLLYWPGARLKD